jgi:hypothetical protein
MMNGVLVTISRLSPFLWAFVGTSAPLASFFDPWISSEQIYNANVIFIFSDVISLKLFGEHHGLFDKFDVFLPNFVLFYMAFILSPFWQFFSYSAAFLDFFFGLLLNELQLDFWRSCLFIAVNTSISLSWNFFSFDISLLEYIWAILRSTWSLGWFLLIVLIQ